MLLAASTIRDGGEPRLSAHDFSLRLLLALALLLQLLSWSTQRGYPIADAVEFMDRAQILVASEALTDTATVRGFAFSSLFVPHFLIAQVLGLEDQRPVLFFARLLQVALALGLVAASARLAQRVAGRSAGLAAGFIVAINPLVMQYGVFPVSGIGAALCLTLGLDRLILRSDRRDGLIGGLWLGLGFLFAYQSLLVALAVLLMLLLRDRWQARSSWVWAGAGLAICFALQLLLDRVVYGRWDGSLWRYLLENAGYTVARVIHDLGWRETAGALYAQLNELRGVEPAVSDVDTPAMMRQGFGWYAINAPSFFVWPLLGLLFAGIAHALLRPRWTSTLALVALALVLFVMGKKGSKSLRLCLPLIPLAVPLFALGFAWLAQRTPSRWLAHLLLLAALPLSLLAYSRAGLLAHSGYWDAADWLGRQVLEHQSSDRPRVASAFDWAVFLRYPPLIERVKLSETLDSWDSLAEPERQRLGEALLQLDWLILHQPLIKAHPGLAAHLAAHFCVAAAFYDQDEAAELGAVLVLRRADRGGARLFEYQAAAPTPENPRQIEFRSELSRASLTLLGFDLQSMPGSGWWWITYHWKLPEQEAKFEVYDRISAPDGANSWQNNHRLGRGSQAPSPQARFLSEGFLFVPSSTKTVNLTSFHPLGGAFRRGDLIPARLWIAVRDFEADLPLKASREFQSTPIQNEFVTTDWAWSVDGYRISKDGLVQAGGFLLPVHESASWRDDGKPMRQ